MERLGTILGHLRRSLEAKAASNLSDRQLLARFVGDRDELAFEVLVWRHAPLVLSVCRRLLRDEQDAEDAFQATFLALVRKAGAIGLGEAVGSWLYKVAYRVALRCRAGAKHRLNCQASDLASLAATPDPDPAARERQRILDDEICRLPAAYRSAVVLCYLEGQTQEAAARQLGCAPGTVAWRLSWARQRLRDRLVRRGLGGCALALGAGSSPALSAPLPLVANTVTVALAFARGEAAPAATVALATGAFAMGISKVKLVAVVVLLVSLFGLGSGLLAWPGADNPTPLNQPELAGDRNSLRLPLAEVTRLGVRVVEVRPRKPAQRRLELVGSLTIAPERLARIRARVGGEIIEEAAGRVGDTVRKGQRLAVVWSGEIAEKKQELLGALLQLALDKEILKRAEQAADAVPEIFLLNAQRNVMADRNAVNRARTILLSRGIAEAEINKIEEYAKPIIAAKYKRDPDKEKETRKSWGRVEVRAPFDGVLLEKNAALHEILEPTTTLYTIGDLRKLNVIAAVAETDLPALMALQARVAPRPIPWQVRVMADKSSQPLPSAGLERFSYLIDPNSHTSQVSGSVDNAAGKGRPGQMVKVTVLLPVAPAEVVVPTAALVEAGNKTWVFVQADPKKPVFTQRRVVVVRRGRDVAHVRLQAEKQHAAPALRVGERVVTEGALELQAALDDLRAGEP